MELHNLVRRSIVRVTKPHSFLTKGRISEGAYRMEDGLRRKKMRVEEIMKRGTLFWCNHTINRKSQFILFYVQWAGLSDID